MVAGVPPFRSDCARNCQCTGTCVDAKKTIRRSRNCIPGRRRQPTCSSRQSAFETAISLAEDEIVPSVFWVSAIPALRQYLFRSGPLHPGNESRSNDRRNGRSGEPIIGPCRSQESSRFGDPLPSSSEFTRLELEVLRGCPAPLQGNPSRVWVEKSDCIA